MSVFENAIVDLGAARRRFGYAPRAAGQITGGARVTGVFGFIDSGLTRTFAVVSNGKLWEDVSGTWTERSSGTPFDTTAPASIAQVGRSIVIADQTNVPRIWNGVGTVDPVYKDLKNANCVGSHKGSLFVGSPTWESTREFASVRWTDTSNPQRFQGKTDLNTTGQPLAIVSTGAERNGVVLIFLSDAVWYGAYSPTAAGGGGAGFEYAFDPLDEGTGVVGAKAVTRVPGKRIFFWGKGEGPAGPYMITEDPVSKPIFIGKRIQAFLSGLDQTNLDEIAAFPVPGYKCVLFVVPYGSSQSTNNYSVYYNWDEDAFAIFKGSSSQAFAFCSGGVVEDSDGTMQCYAGDYSGRVHKVGTGFYDNGQAIETTMWSRWIGGGGMERKWLSLILNMWLAQRKVVEVRYRMYGQDYEYVDTLSGGAPGTPIGEFIIGVSAIAGQNTGRLVGDIYADPSEFIQFGITDSQGGMDFILYGIEAQYEEASRWIKAS